MGRGRPVDAGLLLLLLTCAVVVLVVHSAEDVLVDSSVQWSYWDSATVLGSTGTTWKQTAFVDTAWKLGKAPIGFGNSDEATRTTVNKV